ncbi:MAG: hypothetical protein ACUVTG_04110 [Candidatus Oleimicrobiaceae bacterium]
METWWNVLKWVLVVLATGFVGYVGRFGAAVDRAGPRAAPDRESRHLPPGLDPKDALKAEKKRAKARAKAAKKRAKGGG